MLKQYINLSILLFSSWTVYSACQDDSFLPLFAAGIMILTLLLRLKSSEKQFVFFDRIPLSLVIVLSIVGGFFWRGISPAPADASSPFLEVTSAVQAGAILASLLIWLKPFTRKNIFQLTFLAWVTVAVSINVPFTQPILIIFCTFCIIATAIVILHTMKRPVDKKHTFLHYRHYIFFSILLLMMTIGFFFVISKAVVIFDEVFMNFVSDYVMPGNYTNFLRIDPRLRLISPGRSAWDKHPVLQVMVPDVDEAYLKLQVFKRFDNGTWSETKEIDPTPLPQALDKDLPRGGMTMFASLEKIIPSFYEITSVKGAGGHFTKSKDQILYTDDKQRTRILEFSFKPRNPPVVLSADESAQYMSIPADIASELIAISSGISGGQKDAAAKAKSIQEFFQNNFKYSLSVNFYADDKGILEMIKKKNPAYCSYFATAMTLLVRAQGIPARVATGFLAQERIDKRKNIFLARVLDAHAWTEVLLPRRDPATGETYLRWQTFDPTPATERDQVLDTLGINLARLSDRIWLGMMQFGAYLENLDKDKLKKNLLIAFILLLLFMNRHHIAGGVFRFLGKFGKKLRTGLKKDDTHYVYERYEHYLKTAFGEIRKLTDTDEEVLGRLKERSQIPPETLAKVESFIQHYHAVRFGDNKEIDLEGIIREVEKDRKT